MVDTTYEDFDLWVTPSVKRAYQVRVQGRGGEGSHDFDLPLTKEELAALMTALEGPARDIVKQDHESRTRQAEYKTRVKIFGERLFDATFGGDPGRCFANSWDKAIQSGAGLRIRLRLQDAAEMASLPWEYLYDQSSGHFLSLSEQTPIVRYLELPTPPVALLVPPPLNILVVLSDPEGYDRLKVESEWNIISSAFHDLEDEELVSVSRLPKATLDDLQDALSEKKYHVFHFVGHGGFDPETREPALAFEDQNGKGKLVQTEELRVALDHFSLRLVVLNSCEGARADGVDPFSGLAQSLVQSGIPAAIAMQFKISDRAALTFANRFYRAMINNAPVDSALAAARKSIYLDRNPTEWGTPVLYMHAPDGLIFDIDRPTEEQQRQKQIEALSRDAHAAIDNRDYENAINKLTAIRDLQRMG